MNDGSISIVYYFLTVKAKKKKKKEETIMKNKSQLLTSPTRVQRSAERYVNFYSSYYFFYREVDSSRAKREKDTMLNIKKRSATHCSYKKGPEECPKDRSVSGDEVP